jgi:phosphoglycerate dehydrogenase-like enzyme
MAPLPQGFSEIGGAEALDRFLPDSDFVVICCQWTPETTRLFTKDRFAAMKKGSVLGKVARGEIVDEEALLDAVQRDHLRSRGSAQIKRLSASRSRIKTDALPRSIRPWRCRF